MYYVAFLAVFLIILNFYAAHKGNQSRVSLPIVVLALVVIILSIPLLLSLFLVFATYREIINVILKVKHGEAYRGLLRGGDTVHTVDEISNSKTCILMILEHDEDTSPQPFFEVFAEEFAKLKANVFDKIPKFQSRYAQYAGYTYMLKENVDDADCIKKMPLVESKCGELDEEELAQLLQDCYNSNMSTTYWDFLVGTQPIKRSSGGDYAKRYPVLLRNHHCISDGLPLVKLLLGVLADRKFVSHNEEPSVFDDIFSDVHKLSFDYFVTSLWNIFRRAALILFVLALAPSSMLTGFVLKANDRNFLHGTKLSGESVLAFRVEDGNYIRKVKRIKKSLSDTSFPEIILTAFAGSLRNYFEKKTTTRPEFITCAIPVVPESLQLQSLIPGSVRPQELVFQNNYALALVNLPLFVKNGNLSLTQRLKVLKKQIGILRGLVDYYVLHTVTNYIFSVLPTKAISFFLYNFDCTTSASIIPGCDTGKITFVNGAFTATDSGFWTPHIHNIGVGFTVFTYEQRLFVGMSVDKALIKSRQEVQSLIDDVLRNVDLFEEEIESLKTNLMQDSFFE